ncbi:MAG: TauD/TfdA dioxygenase family protein [Acidimicrobiales bacterium]
MTTTVPSADPLAEKDPGAHLRAKRMTLGRWDIEVGPLGYLAEERQRLDALRWDRFDVRRLGATIGAVIEGVDLTGPLDDGLIAELRRALLDYKVVFFRDQPLTAAQHVAFARRFGELEVHPFIPPNDAHPELVRFAKSADVGGYENGWHSDVTWREKPSMAAILHAVEVPPTGGDTLFSDMYAAYDSLDEAMRARIAPLHAVHDYMLAFGAQVPPDQRDAVRAQYPQVVHPVVRTHEETGRKLVYVNRFFVDHIVETDDDESAALIDRLSRRAETVEHQCRWIWEPHSVAMWDNRAVQHYACSDYWPSVRVMERASVVGPRPA